MHGFPTQYIPKKIGGCLTLFVLLTVIFFQAYAQPDSVRVQDQLARVCNLKYSNPALARLHLDSAETIANDSKDDKLRGNVMYYRAMLLYLSNDYINCIPLAENALGFYINANHSYGKASIYNLLGLTYNSLGDYQEAIESFHKSLEIAEKGDNLYAISNPYHNIALNYKQIREYSKALDYAMKALDIRRQIGDSTFIAESFQTIGTLHYHLRQYKEAEEWHNQAIAYFESTDSPIALSKTYNSLALIYDDTGDIDHALVYYEKALHLARENEGGGEDAVNTLCNLSILASRQKDYDRAKKLAIEARKIAEDIGILPGLRIALEALYMAQEGKRNYREALETHKQFLGISDSLLNTEKIKYINTLEARYQSAQKDKSILQQQQLIQQKELDVQSRTIWLISVVSVLLLIAAVLFFLYKRKGAIARQAELELKLAEERQRFHIQQERLRISRELHDNIGSQLTFINHSLESAGDFSRAAEVKKLTLDTIHELRKTVWLINQSSVKVEEFVVKIREYLNKGTSVPIHVNATGQLDRELSSAEATQVFRVIQEAVNNTLKHANATTVSVRIDSSGEKLSISVHDDGKGFDVTQPVSGFGLRNMKERIQSIGGDINISSDDDGTVVLMSF